MKKKDSRIRSFVLRITGIGIALYGIRAFFYREMPTYLFLQTEFVYFDFTTKRISTKLKMTIRPLCTHVL